jgi:hypothetical protein
MMRVMTDGWPNRSEVDDAWREVIAGARSRGSAHDWIVPWVEGEFAHGRASDLMISNGRQYLHGLDLVTRYGDGLRQYVSTMQRSSPVTRRGSRGALWIDAS